MKTLRLLPSAFALLCGFVSQSLPARDYPSFPDGPDAYGDQVSLRRAQHLKVPENAAVFKSAIHEMTLSSGYVSSFRDPNYKTAKRVLNGDVQFDFSTGEWINSKTGEPLRDVMVQWGDRYLSVDQNGHGTIFTETEEQKKAQAAPRVQRVLRRPGEALNNVMIGLKPATPDVWLQPPPISTPKTDAVRKSQGESIAPGGSLRQAEPKIRELIYPAEEHYFIPSGAEFRPANGGARTQDYNLLSDEQIRIRLVEEATTSLWDPRPKVLGAILPHYLELGSDQTAPDIFSLLRKNVLHRHDWLEAPKISTPKADRLRQSFGEGVEVGFERINPPRPVSPKLKTIGFLGATAEAAAGFPGEVIDEVIVPVPSEIFLVLDKLGKPDWKGQLRSGKQPSLSNRIDVSLLLGSVVAEGFVAVQAEDRSAVEQIGKDVLRLSESLGLKETVLPHTNSILEASKHNHWEIVRVELDKTQKTVRDTMEQRRDAELAQCVSLGGWLRGTEAVTDLINKNYTSDSAELLNQPDIVRHFQKELKKLATRNQKLRNMLAGLETIAGVIGTGDEPPNAGGVQAIHTTTAKLVKSIATPSK